MAAARERQRANIVTKQVVGGKEWVGPAFLCKPSTLEFRDFVPGEVYRVTFTLTNVSYTFNSFRPQPLPDAHRSFFELTHDPPGRMSAGTSLPLTLVFEPKLNVDIDTELTLMTATGPQAIPLRCTVKVAAPPPLHGRYVAVSWPLRRWRSPPSPPRRPLQCRYMAVTWPLHGRYAGGEALPLLRGARLWHGRHGGERHAAADAPQRRRPPLPVQVRNGHVTAM